LPAWVLVCPLVMNQTALYLFCEKTVAQGGQSPVAAGDQVGPGPSLIQAQDAPTAGGDHAGGDTEQP